MFLLQIGDKFGLLLRFLLQSHDLVFNIQRHLPEQGVVLKFCKITEPRKNQLEIEIKHTSI